MVLGAHIQPLGKKDKMEGCQNGKRPQVVWNTAVMTNESRKFSQVHESEPVGQSAEERKSIFTPPMSIQSNDE